MYTAMQVAKFVVSYCSKLGKPVSNLKLQKLLYFIWIGFFKETHNSIFRDDICAWQFGPVVPSVYYEYCSYAGNPIRETYEDSSISLDDQATVISIVNNYIDVSASVLVSNTHISGSPWDIVYRNGLGIRRPIPHELIQQLECEN